MNVVSATVIHPEIEHEFKSQALCTARLETTLYGPIDHTVIVYVIFASE